MTLTELRRAGRAPRLPLAVCLPGGELVVTRWLRVLPNRRYVGVAEWQGRRVLAKLLVGKRAQRDYRNEIGGHEALRAAGSLTPALLGHGLSAGAGAWLLFDYLDGAVSLGEQWQGVANAAPLSAAQQAVLGQALVALGALHARGLWQEDLHLDNLLCDNDKLLWVDCGSIRRGSPGRPLDSEKALENLGVFFAQLPACFDRFAGELLAPYRQGGGGAVHLDALLRHIAKVRRWRLNDYLEKAGRDCTLFSVRRGAMGLWAVRRGELDTLQPLLDNPDRYIASGASLKKGGSATVARVELAGRPLVVKRYNIKGPVHWLRRCWRPSRAWRSWREGHRLEFLGIATAKPLAVIEERRCWLRGRAWLISEWLGGESIHKRWAAYADSAPPLDEILALVGLFTALCRERISHGDLKGSNLIWTGAAWALIDLDAMRQHRTRVGFARAYARDRARFLKNWPVNSSLYRLLDQRLPVVPASAAGQEDT